jgi:hypothetical protein
VAGADQVVSGELDQVEWHGVDDTVSHYVTPGSRVRQLEAKALELLGAHAPELREYLNVA